MRTVIAASDPYEEDASKSKPIAGTPSNALILRSTYSSFANRRPSKRFSNDILSPGLPRDGTSEPVITFRLVRRPWAAPSKRFCITAGVPQKAAGLSHRASRQTRPTRHCDERAWDASGRRCRRRTGELAAEVHPRTVSKKGPVRKLPSGWAIRSKIGAVAVCIHYVLRHGEP